MIDSTRKAPMIRTRRLWLGLLFFAAACEGREEAKPAEPSPLSLLLPDQLPREATDLWDGRVENMIYIHHRGWNDMFALHLFEDLLVPIPKDQADIRYKNNRRLDETRFRWARPAQAGEATSGTEQRGRRSENLLFEMEQTEGLDFKLQGRMWIEGNQARVEGDITNRGAQKWWRDYPPTGLMCLRHHLNKEFHDPRGDRIFIVNKETGQREIVFDVAGAENKFFNIPLIGPKQLPYKPRAEKVNDAGTRRVVFESTPCASLLGNRDNNVCCIHANYDLTCESGGTVHFSSVITFEDVK